MCWGPKCDSTRTPEETWTNLQKWSEVLQRPRYNDEDAEYNLSDESWSLIKKLITYADLRYKTIEKVQQHPWFADVDWERLRDIEPPYVPELYMETDTRYFDDFDSEEDKKYNEVRKKQRHVDGVEEVDNQMSRSVWVGFTFGKNGPNLSISFLAYFGQYILLDTLLNIPD
ncbi:hypothetical protein PsYK624_137610 [Phanerochaete sordida]|uniref:non-specific serine/threonine protein kinase n=1 Tax=Phanerochaete sordida TaxID=48140 RepID=A0A9P3LJN0_9APHY|nr:hypothetical protein PsYK624_137610 [Phanerochaete sordida]